MSLSSVAMGKLLGISHAAVLKAAKRGRIPREPDGGFDEAKVRAALATNTDLRQKREKRVPQTAEVADSNQGPVDQSFHEAQRAREWVRVAKEKLALAKAQAKLIDATEAEQAWSGMIIAAQQKLLSLPNALALRVAHEADPVECEQIIRGGILSALNELSEYRPSHG
jgi:hypothetical protein